MTIKTILTSKQMTFTVNSSTMNRKQYDWQQPYTVTELQVLDLGHLGRAITK